MPDYPLDKFRQVSLTPPDDCSFCGYKGRDLPEGYHCMCCGYYKPLPQPVICKYCDQPIKPCTPWGWHHADDPVICFNGQDLVATPKFPKERDAYVIHVQS